MKTSDIFLYRVCLFANKLLYPMIVWIHVISCFSPIYYCRFCIRMYFYLMYFLILFFLCAFFVGIVVLPCGAGKTLTGVTAVSTVKRRAIVLCTSNIAVEQWRREFVRWCDVDHRIVRKYVIYSIHILVFSFIPVSWMSVRYDTKYSISMRFDYADLLQFNDNCSFITDLFTSLLRQWLYELSGIVIDCMYCFFFLTFSFLTQVFSFNIWLPFPIDVWHYDFDFLIF